MTKYSPRPSVSFHEFTNKAAAFIRLDRATYKEGIALSVNASVGALGIDVFSMPIALMMDKLCCDEVAG